MRVVIFFFFSSSSFSKILGGCSRRCMNICRFGCCYLYKSSSGCLVNTHVTNMYDASAFRRRATLCSDHLVFDARVCQLMCESRLEVNLIF